MTSSPSPVPTSRSTLVLATVVAVIKPLVRLLLRHGVAYPAFVAALKPVFLAAARDELAGRGMVQTDSALSLLSGVHRRDVRTLLRGPGAVDTISSGPARAPAGALERTAPAGEPSGTDHEPPRTVPDEQPRTVPDAPRPALGLAGEVVARWLSDPRYLGADDQPRALSRGPSPAGFDALVQAISSDVRPRAVLDELLRLGVAEFDETGAQVRLRAAGFAPRQGFEEMAWLMRANLHDHLAGACANLDEDRNFLEQSIHVDEITEDSARRLHRVAAQAWRQAFRTVMREAQARFDDDAVHADPAQRTQRARFGAYFYDTRQDASHD